MLHYIWIFLTSVVGGLLQSSIGFGYGVIAITIFSLFFTFIPYAAATSMLVSLVCSIWLLYPRVKKTRMKVILPILIAYGVLMPVASYFAIDIPKIESGVFLGAVLVILGVFYLFFADRTSMRATTLNAVLAGILAGILGGMFSMSGPPVVLYCLSALDDKEEYMASVQAFFIITNVYGAVVRTLNGGITAQVLLWALSGVLGLGIGVVLGRKIYKKMDMHMVRKWVYAFIGCTGIWLLVSNIGQLA